MFYSTVLFLFRTGDSNLKQPPKSSTLLDLSLYYYIVDFFFVLVEKSWNWNWTKN